jgi:2-methylisocitrate lyase-like PEP mutase family enzyme
MGVRRISVGSSLSRAALGAFLRAAREMRESGTFEFAKDAVSGREINSIFAPKGSVSPVREPLMESALTFLRG